MQYLTDILDAVTALPVDAVLGGVFLALVLTSPVGLAYAVGRRRGKDVSMMLVGLATAMNFIGMALAIGHAQYVNNSAAVKRRQTSPLPRCPAPTAAGVAQSWHPTNKQATAERHYRRENYSRHPLGGGHGPQRATLH